MSSTQNFKAYRELLHNTDKVCVPYLGIYLTDLTFIEEGNKNVIPSTVSSKPASPVLPSTPLKDEVAVTESAEKPPQLSKKGDPNAKMLINFEKRRMIAAVILEVQQYQQSYYHLLEEPFIKEFLLGDMPTITDEEAYNISLQIEPRQ